MAVNVDLTVLFEKIGRMYIQLGEQDKAQLALREQNTELSRVAGEALRALEVLGRKDLADKITKGETWNEAIALDKTPTIAVVRS